MSESVRQCNKCGYDLTGTKGLHGSCPECGNFWDVLSGKGLGPAPATARRKADKLLARIRTIAIAVFSLFVLMCAGLGSYLAQNSGGNPLRPLAIGGLVAGVGFLAAFASYFYEDE